MPEANLSPTTQTAMRVGDARLRELRPRRGGKDTVRQQVVRVESSRSDGAVCRPKAWRPVGGPRAGVNDPGVAWPVRPRALVCWGRSRPALPMSDEAREPPLSSGGSAGPQVQFRSHSMSSARMARRPSRPGGCALDASPCKVLRCAPTARYARLARVGVASWTAVIVGQRETLTAPLSERVTLAIA